VTNKETSARKHHVDCLRTRYGRTPKAAGPFGSVGVVTGESFIWTAEGDVGDKISGMSELDDDERDRDI
jgi:hypothetical protein